ncbi:hypothetical protein ACE3MZ_04980 [Paenibacillus sp. WLX1005]|uniref:hypothetical protein n=1 Tax=unclassified Paenibacillus TaxID=185978 RepID=UPI0039840DAE
MADKQHYDDVFWKTKGTLLDDEDAQSVSEELEPELPRDAELAVIHPERLDQPLHQDVADEEDSGPHPQADPEDQDSDTSLARHEDEDQND